MDTYSRSHTRGQGCPTPTNHLNPSPPADVGLWLSLAVTHVWEFLFSTGKKKPSSKLSFWQKEKKKGKKWQWRVMVYSRFLTAGICGTSLGAQVWLSAWLCAPRTTNQNNTMMTYISSGGLNIRLYLIRHIIRVVEFGNKIWTDFFL